MRLIGTLMMKSDSFVTETLKLETGAIENA